VELKGGEGVGVLPGGVRTWDMRKTSRCRLNCFGTRPLQSTFACPDLKYIVRQWKVILRKTGTHPAADSGLRRAARNSYRAELERLDER